MSTRYCDYYFENNLSSSSSAVSFRICSLICSRAAFYSSLVFGLCVLGSALLPPTASASHAYAPRRTNARGGITHESTPVRTNAARFGHQSIGVLARGTKGERCSWQREIRGS